MKDVKPVLENILKSKKKLTEDERKTIAIGLEHQNQQRCLNGSAEHKKMFTYNGNQYWILKDFMGRDYHVPVNCKILRRASWEYDLIVATHTHNGISAKYLKRVDKNTPHPEVQEFHQICEGKK
jgi:hypothetical protein